MKKRCINIDWLEVYGHEPADITLNAEYFQRSGFEVKVRAYGTPQYREMFTIYRGLCPFIEVRRSPYSLREQGGIFDINSCHLRLTNFACYLPSPIDELRSFMFQFGYTLDNISRVDICLDMLSFDDGSDPGRFLADYAQGKFFKNHLSKIAPRGVEVIGSDFMGHGIDSPYMRIYNSWKWGAPSSAISVKLYNKSQELFEVQDKPYIRQQWLAAGLITDDDNKLLSEIRDSRYYISQLSRNQKKAKGDKKRMLADRLNDEKHHLAELKKKEKQIWRLEFSINSDIKGFVTGDNNDIDNYGNRKIYPLMLSTIENRHKCLFLFYALAKRYFEFKKVAYTRNGTRQRKDRCPSYWPISYNKDSVDYRPVRVTSTTQPSRMDKIIINKIRRIIDDNNENPHLSAPQVEAMLTLISYFRQIYKFDELDKIYNAAIMYFDKESRYDVAQKEEELQKILQSINKIETLNNRYNV